MRAAPEMSPTLDDALRAADYPLATHDAQRLRPVLAFLNQLDDVRDVPAVVLDRAQAEHMEGAYLAGVRCADESGHVLVMSLPAFLQLCPPPVPRASPWARAGSAFEQLGRHVGPVGLALAVTCVVFAFGGMFQWAGAAWLASVLLVLRNWLCSMPSACTRNCNEGRACTCAPQSMKEAK